MISEDVKAHSKTLTDMGIVHVITEQSQASCCAVFRGEIVPSFPEWCIIDGRLSPQSPRRFTKTLPTKLPFGCHCSQALPL